MKTFAIVMIATIVALGLGYIAGSTRRQKQIDQLQLILTQERTEHMLKLADAYHRQDEDDILLLIEAPISLEATLHKRVRNQVRDDYFQRHGIMSRIDQYLAEHPESGLKEGLVEDARK